MTNADRQKAYRDRKRNAPVTESAPKRNAQADDSVTADCDCNAPVTQPQPVTLRTGNKVTVSVTPDKVFGEMLIAGPAPADTDFVKVGVTRAHPVTPNPFEYALDPAIERYKELEFIGPDVYYHPRTNPQCINWGEPMTGSELKAAGLVANRVSIPGDWDYAGVVDDTGKVAVLRNVA